MIPRHLTPAVKKYAAEYPLVAIVGPRQSGKTTLARTVFPDHAYVSLEDLDTRHQATDDPRGFLQDHRAPIILDEIQRAPDLFSYLQSTVYADPTPGQYVLTGSHQFLLMERVTQSLAGRIAIFKLYPFSVGELYSLGKALSLDEILEPRRSELPENLPKSHFDLIFAGFYPRIHDRKLDPRKWLEGYVQTYLERDIRQLVNVGDLRVFENFLKLCAGRSGQLLNYASMGNAIGISQPTVKRWVSLLETSGVVYILPPYYENFSKRITKSPRLYFTDTGLLCFLLSIRRPSELFTHPLFGSIFETFVVADLFKRVTHLGEQPLFYYWRDRTGNEIDLVVDFSRSVLPVEIKSARTFSPSFRATVERWIDLSRGRAQRGLIVYAGERIVGRGSRVPAVPWWSM